MTKKQSQRYTHLVQSLAMLGFSQDETDRLLKIERTLQRWHELECGDQNDYGTSYHIERDEVTGKPSMVYHFRDGRKSRHPVADREKGALKRLADIMEKHEGFSAYVQGDPRGCALYIIRPNDVPKGEDVNAYYSRGIAICY
jgi:hypothetical protein